MVRTMNDTLLRSFSTFLTKLGRYQLFSTELVASGEYLNIHDYVRSYGEDYLNYDLLVICAFHWESSDNKRAIWKDVHIKWKEHLKKHKKISPSPTKGCKSIW